MRSSFEQKIKMLNESIETIYNDFNKKIWEKDNEIKDLKEANRIFQKRVKEMTKGAT